jgi:hypothetical protein
MDYSGLMMQGAGLMHGLGQGLMSPTMRQTYNAAVGGYGDLYRTLNAMQNLGEMRLKATQGLSPMDEVERLRSKAMQSRHRGYPWAQGGY